MVARMHDSASPRKGRTGRPRSAETDQAILCATRAALVDLGWGRLTMSDVAARAGVAKTTLYRRWANKNELVVDAVAVLFDELELPTGARCAPTSRAWCSSSARCWPGRRPRRH